MASDRPSKDWNVRGETWLNRSVPVVSFIAAFFAVPVARLGGLALMPGDLGDARLNNYFLENCYLFFAGRGNSLWHLGFFHPFPYVLGFSDNLFGSAPVYALARVLTGQPDTAYQLWFLFAYAANFAAAYYALRHLGASPVAASAGALIFAFALPTTAHAEHAQLHYRFGLPLAIACFVHFLDGKSWRSLFAAGAWMVWQFYCSIYMGFFTLLLLVAAALAYVAYTGMARKILPGRLAAEFLSRWRAQAPRERWKIVAGLVLLLGLLALLFYPYQQVAHLYHAKRPWSEVASMLPRLQSYFLADASRIWSAPGSALFARLPMRNEHQMFIGAVPMVLALLGLFAGCREKNRLVFALMSGMLGITIVVTLYFGGYSLWHLLYRLPLASAIRAMTRVDQALLFPCAYLAAVAIDQLRSRQRWIARWIWIVVIPLLLIECSATTMNVSAKQVWRNRLQATEAKLPRQLPEDAVVFIAQGRGPFYAEELDAMWAALSRGVKTLNGYSGYYPPGYSPEYGNGCSEVAKRVTSYLMFSGQRDRPEAYREWMKRIVPVGFEGCDESGSAPPGRPAPAER
jgi:hypothetical protein